MDQRLSIQILELGASIEMDRLTFSAKEKRQETLSNMSWQSECSFYSIEK